MNVTSPWFCYSTSSRKSKVSIQEYRDWSKKFIFEAITGQRYGQSFCNYFGIEDYVLFFERDSQWCEHYITSTYIENTQSQ